MKCPYCGHINDWDKDQCLMCRRDIAYLRDRVLLGQQFAFFEASEEQPILVTLIPASTYEEEEHRFTGPTIVSRHEYGVKLERRPVGGVSLSEMGLFPGTPLPGPGWGRDPGEPFELPALDFPRLDLMTVTTDRKVYRVGDEVYIFIAAPDAAGGEAALEVRLDGQEGTHQAGVRLNQAGLGLSHLADLEAGEYSVVVSLPDRSGAGATCSFTCAEFKLSALVASLESHIIRGTQLSIILNLTRHAVPYDGPLELVVRNAGQVVYQGQAEARAGRLEADLPLEALTVGGVTLEVTTPEGDAAILPGLGVDWDAWDKITLNALDAPVEAAIAPFPDAEGEIRGLHYIHKSDTGSPFRLERLVATEGRVQACRDVPFVNLLVFDPLSGGGLRMEFQGVKAGDVLRFEVGAPYAVFILGALMGRALPYEAWGVVMRPVELGASLDAPEEAAPGAGVTVRVETDRPAHCLLLVYDARMAGRDPLTGLARRIFEHIFDATWRLEAGRATQVAWLLISGLQTMELQLRLRGGGQSMRSHLRQSYQAALKRGAPRAFFMAPDEAFPAMAHVKLFPVHGRVEVPVQLGDQAGPWRCRAYVFHGHDYVSLSRDIEVM